MGKKVKDEQMVLSEKSSKFRIYILRISDFKLFI
jgi:hypothetical protein